MTAAEIADLRRGAVVGGQQVKNKEALIAKLVALRAAGASSDGAGAGDGAAGEEDASGDESEDEGGGYDVSADGYAALVGLEFDDEDGTACRVLEVRASGAVFEALYYAVEDHPDRARVTAADCEGAAAARVAQMLP